MSELVGRFATSPERGMILRGFKQFRDELRAVGFQNGFQWIDGSFVEACELVKRRAPGDVDVVSVLHRPPGLSDPSAWNGFVQHYSATLLDPDFCKAAYRCDAYFIDLDTVPRSVSQQSAYWFGLFSHQRDTFRWKGLVQVDLLSDDGAAMQSLDAIETAGW